LKLENANVRGRIKKFPDWPSVARTANGTALCHWMQLYRYFVSQSSEFCHRSPLCCFSTSNTKGKSIFRYRLSPETLDIPSYISQNLVRCLLRWQFVFFFLNYRHTDPCGGLLFHDVIMTFCVSTSHEPGAGGGDGGHRWPICAFQFVCLLPTKGVAYILGHSVHNFVA
jgi:hypothetical protein